MPPLKPLKVYFVSGYDRNTSLPNAVETVWTGNTLRDARRVNHIPEGVPVIPMFRAELEDLLAGRDAYDQPWHKAR